MARWMAVGAVALLCPWQACWADSIRVDDTWHRDVYVVTTAQFYQILFPETGGILQVSRKRQDIGAPRLTKDEAERAALKARWDEANARKSRADARDAEIRSSGVSTITNLDEEGVPFITSQPSPQLQYRLEDRQPIEPPLPVSEGEMEAPLAPPGPREAPLPPEPVGEDGLTDAEYQMLLEEERQMEFERLRAQPYYLTDEEALIAAELERLAQERMAEEALYLESLRSQGYIENGEFRTEGEAVPGD